MLILVHLVLLTVGHGKMYISHIFTDRYDFSVYIGIYYSFIT